MARKARMARMARKARLARMARMARRWRVRRVWRVWRVRRVKNPTQFIHTCFFSLAFQEGVQPLPAANDSGWQIFSWLNFNKNDPYFLKGGILRQIMTI